MDSLAIPGISLSQKALKPKKPSFSGITKDPIKPEIVRFCSLFEDSKFIKANTIIKIISKLFSEIPGLEQVSTSGVLQNVVSVDHSVILNECSFEEEEIKIIWNGKAFEYFKSIPSPHQPTCQITFYDKKTHPLFQLELHEEDRKAIAIKCTDFSGTIFRRSTNRTYDNGSFDIGLGTSEIGDEVIKQLHKYLIQFFKFHLSRKV